MRKRGAERQGEGEGDGEWEVNGERQKGSRGTAGAAWGRSLFTTYLHTE